MKKIFLLVLMLIVSFGVTASAAKKPKPNTLKNLSDAEKRRILRLVSKDLENKSNIETLGALGKIGVPALEKLLKTYYKSKVSWTVAVQAIEALGTVEDIAGAKALTRVLTHMGYKSSTKFHGWKAVTTKAFEMLCNTKQASMIPFVVRWAKNRNKWTGIWLQKSIAKFGEPIVKHLLRVSIPSKDTTSAVSFCVIYLEIGVPGIPGLLKFLKNKNKSVSSRALLYLERIAKKYKMENDVWQFKKNARKWNAWWNKNKTKLLKAYREKNSPKLDLEKGVLRVKKEDKQKEK